VAQDRAPATDAGLALALDTSACAEPWTSGLERFARIELGSAERTPRALDVVVACAADRVDISVSQPGQDGVSRRSMDLSSTAESVRARVVALAIAGLARELALVANANAERDTAGAREDHPDRPAPTPEAARDAPVAAREPTASAGEATAAPPPTREVGHDLEFDLLLQAGNYAASSDVVWGGGVRVQWLPFAPWRLAFDVQGGTESRDTALGSVHLLTGSIGARGGYTLGDRSIALVAGAGGRVGLARASASAGSHAGVEAGAVLGAWAAPVAFLSFEGAVLGHYRFGIDGELGVVALPVRGRIEQGEDIVVSGLWAAASVVFGIRF
jgi:hypothetical protein